MKVKNSPQRLVDLKYYFGYEYTVKQLDNGDWELVAKTDMNLMG
jgi:hypothetical protein